MKGKFTWIVLAIVVIGGAWWLLSSGSTNTASTTGPIKIGFVAPLTGDAAAYGEPIQNGVKLAVDEINKAGGVNGRQLEMTYEDGKCAGQDAASAAQKLVNVDGVKYIIGGVCSAESFSIVPIISAAKVLEISPGSSAPKLAGSSPYFLRNNPNDNQPATALADYLAVTKSYKKVAIISEKTDYAQGLKTVFVAQVQKDSAALVSAEDYDSNTTDFRSLLTKVKGTNPNVIFINSQTSANLLRIASQARQLKINTQLASAVFNDSTTVGAGAIVNGLILADPPGLSTEGKGPAFLAGYKAAYGAEPTYPFFAGAAYDDVYLIAQAITNAGDDATKVDQYLHSLPSFTGTIGTYHFDQSGDFVGVNSILQQIQNGKVVNL